MNNLRHIASLLLLSAMLTACGSGGSSSSAAPSQAINQPNVNDPSSDPDLDGAARARLTWDAPTMREDGSEFAQTEIAYYEIYHVDDSSGDMDIIAVDADATEYSIALAAGSHELGIAVVDTNGVTSQMSELQTIDIY